MKISILVKLNILGITYIDEIFADISFDANILIQALEFLKEKANFYWRFKIYELKLSDFLL
jgi:hypothetical protein